ncbi:hypothetical protein FRC03_005567 [Tulasnella sp. 419]|nr:hypothetical protein FRC03_005567 [Tulasnella sp. 419]
MDFYRPIHILAKKYDMAKLIDLYLPHVIEGWPTNLDEWDGLEEEMQLKAKRLSKKSGTPGFVDDEFVEPASMLQLAHHFPDSLAPILPAVYYQLARTPSPKKGSPQWLSYVGSGGRTANWSFVPVSDYEALSAGQHAIKEHFLDLARRPHTLMSWPNPCSRVTTYSQKTMYCLPLRWWEAQLPGFLLTRLDTKRGDILAIYQELIDGFQSISSYNQDVPVWLCDPCRAAISSQLKPAREMFWNKLPEYFGIKASVIDL